MNNQLLTVTVLSQATVAAVAPILATTIKDTGKVATSVLTDAVAGQQWVQKTN